ncbi:transposase, partial [bacterium AH-315-B06]|nr:transposase [bacterium AH-315-B06]
GSTSELKTNSRLSGQTGATPLHAFSGGGNAREGIGAWIDFYNNRRPHTAHGGATPAGVYRDRPSVSGPDLRPGLEPTVLAA